MFKNQNKQETNSWSCQCYGHFIPIHLSITENQKIAHFCSWKQSKKITYKQNQPEKKTISPCVAPHCFF